MNERGACITIPRSERRAFVAIVRPKPLHETVVERLRDMIVEGELASGERLHDANLAKTLQVSRTPIREATKLLATEGLVDLLPGRGARVSELSSADITDLFETIAGIERHACELAAERMSGRDLGKLQRAHKSMARHHAAGERLPYFKLNHEIHLAIVEGSKNATLQAIHASLMCRARDEPATPRWRRTPAGWRRWGSTTRSWLLWRSATPAARARSCASMILALPFPSSPRSSVDRMRLNAPPGLDS